MASKNPFWAALRKNLRWVRNQNWFAVAMATAVLPIVEAILVNQWSSTSGTARTPVTICLFVVGAIHLFFVIATLASAAACPPSLVADAAETHDSMSTMRGELERREQAYRLVRQAFDKLNSQTCIISVPPEFGPKWCDQGFSASVAPVIQVLVDNAEVALGVSSRSFTIEIYYLEGLLPRSAHEQMNDDRLRLEYVHPGSTPTPFPPDTARSPAVQAFNAGVPLRQHIAQTPHFFFDGAKPLPDVYFKRYVACPLPAACGPEDALGVLVVTSQQDADFASDAEDMLAFFASIIANLQFRYTDCIARRYESEAKMRKQEPAA